MQEQTEKAPAYIAKGRDMSRSNASIKCTVIYDRQKDEEFKVGF